MTFRVREKVVCVDGKACEGKYTGLVEGDIYTVNGFGTCDDGSVGVCLVENDDPKWPFYPRRFRPIVEPKTEISFTTGADPSSGQFDNRRKVRKKVTT